MSIALLIARLLLALVFVIASLAKLADLPGSRQALRNFGLPALLANPFGVLLPLAELAIAVALIPTVSAWWGALGSLVLIFLFIAGISYNLARGRTPDCHCFGQLYSKPIGWPTLSRNLLLTAVAGFIIWQGRTNAGLSAVDWLGALTLAQRIELLTGVIVVALLAGESWLLFQMLRQQGRLLLRIEAIETQLAADSNVPQSATESIPTPVAPGLPVGSPAPAFALSGIYGETLTLDSLRAPGKPVLLIFSDSGCGPCSALMPEVGRWQRDHAAKLTLTVISRGTPEDNRAKSTEHGITSVLLQKDREIAEAYQAYGTPGAVLIRPDGTIDSPLAQGADAIRALVAGAVGLPVLRNLPMAAPTNGNGHTVAAPTNQPATPKVSEPAPEFTLPALTGEPVSLSDFRGSKTLVLFWNPGCGFCQRMLDDLRAWEARPPEGAPKFLVVSTGSAESNEAMGLKSTVVLDQGFGTGSNFGAGGTPMAVLVDAEGKIASEVAAGAEAVLALAGAEQAPTPTNGSGAAVPGTYAKLKVGEPAPAFTLPNLNGKKVNLSDFRDKKTLILFWNPGCGFCQRMLDDLKAWEARPPKDAPKLLVISTGTVEENQALGLRSTILLDQDMSVGSKFEANGTPMGILIDARGKIASELAVGAPAVLALAGAGKDLVQPITA